MTKTKLPAATTLLLCWLLCVASKGQTVCQPDSVRMYFERDEINEGTWTDDYSDTCDVTFTYNPDGTLKQFYKRTVPKGYWNFVFVWRCNYKYDHLHRCVHQKKYCGGDLDFCVYHSCRDFHYDGNHPYPSSAINLLMMSCPHAYVDSLWNEYEYEHDSLGRIVREDLYRGGKRFKEVRYEYGPNTMTETLDAYPSQESDDWKTLTRVTRTYSDDGKLLISLRTLHNDSTRLTLYNYDLNGHLTEVLVKKRDNGVFIDEKRVVYELNNDGWPSTVRFEKLSDGEWVEGTSPVYWLNYQYQYNKIECSDFFFFTADHLKFQNDLLPDGGVKRMELFYTQTPNPCYKTSEQVRPGNSAMVFPNPATGRVTLTGESIREVEIHNLLGQRVAVVEGHDAESLTVSLEGLPEGVYLVSIRLADGKRCEKKLVVH